MTPDDIQTEYRKLGMTAGWRFMTAPAGNLTAARVAVITLNPGGRSDLETSPAQRWSSEAGSAYRIESWGGTAAGADPLQVQIKRLCALLGTTPDEILSGHFVPFRSNAWTELPRRGEAALFGLKLWRWALAQSPADLFVCIGKKVVGDGIASIFGARQVSSAPTGWGDQTFDRYRDARGRRILALPHLGRFRLLGDARREALFMEALKF
ncbi:MAG: hypothetical protein QM698_07085 [Micropepsaceae bacterium]